MSRKLIDFFYNILYTIPSNNMTYTTEIVMDDGFKETIITYDSMNHSDILDIFEEELSYRILKKYARDEDDYTQVMTRMYRRPNDYRFMVWLGTDLVLDENYGENHDSHMNYKLIEYQCRCDEEEEEEDEDEEIEEK